MDEPPNCRCTSTVRRRAAAGERAVTNRRLRVTAGAAVLVMAAIGLTAAPAGATPGNPPSAPPFIEPAPDAGLIQVFFAGSFDDGGAPITQYNADCTSG